MKRPRPRGWAGSSDHPPKRMTKRWSPNDDTLLRDYPTPRGVGQMPVAQGSHAAAAGRYRGKKKAPRTKEWSLKIGPKPQSKVVADERGRRIRHLPGGHAPREENSAHRPVSHNLGRGRRKRAKSVATRRICSRARAAAMRQTTCQLCALRRERTVLLTEKNMAPLGG